MAARAPRTPAIAVWALRVGGGLALLCGGLLSFVALYRLGLENGWPNYVAWAFPVSVDVLAAVAVLVAMAVTRDHPAASIAHWCAGIALLMTVGCNIEYHALLPATHWSVGHIFLVATGAAPALVVELIIVMQMYLGDGAALAAQDASTAPRAQTQRAAEKKRAAPAPETSIEQSAPRALPQETTAPLGAPANALDTAPPRRQAAPAPTAPVADELAQARQNTSERTTAILDLMLQHGPDTVTGAMVAAHFGVHDSNGKRALAKVRKLPDLPQRLAQRARETTDSLDDPQREAASA